MDSDDDRHGRVATISSLSAEESAACRPRGSSGRCWGRTAKVLVLDNHDDFGGHAKRNEFHSNGRMLLLNGGTLNIEAPKQYSPQAMGLLRAIGIDIDRFEREIAPTTAFIRR